MKKQILLFILALLPMVAKADESGTCGDNLTYTYETATRALRISGIGSMKDYEYYYNSPWFNYRNAISSVVIEDGVTSIGDRAFWECSSLTSITIGNSVTSIGDDAFYSCSSLTSITIPNGVTSIGDYTFESCSGLTSITIPNSVTSIGDYVFSGCSGLTSINIPNGITSIGDGAFRGCSGLTSINIPHSVTSIGKKTFSGCTGLTSITIPNSVTSIENSAFERCVGLTSIIIPNSVTSIGNSAFEHCVGLTSITIPNSVTSIGEKTFSGCTGLTSITIPNSVTSIENSAFERCVGLTSITIPNGVTNIGNSAFNECTGLTSITIPNSVTSIGRLAFAYCSGLTSITIPNSVTSIGGRAFWYCSGLTSINIGNSVTSIGEAAFHECTCLTSITIPNSVTSIEYGAFSHCSGLTSIKVESGNSVYDSRNDCNAIIITETNELIAGCKNTIIPNSVTSVGGCAFHGCSGLTSINIPNSVTNIGNYAFDDCSGLTSITIPNSVTSIGEEAFSDCFGLTSITIPNSVTSIGERAFYVYSKLANVYCYAETLPSTSLNTFKNSDIKNSTLHVPASAIDEYRATEPWSTFGTIVPLPKVIYMIDGEVWRTLTPMIGETITPEVEPTKEGYTFSGWSEIPETMPDHDVTITGSFTINHYTLTLMVGDNVYETKTLDYGSTIVVPEMPELTGYTFTWGEVPATMPAKDVTIVGEYQPNLYNVTYLIDGLFYAIYKVAYGSTITPPEVPEHEGSTFSWGEYPEKMPAHDIIIEGTYTDGIDLVHDAQNVEIYTLDGKKVNRMQRGVNIIRRGSKVMKVKR